MCSSDLQWERAGYDRAAARATRVYSARSAGQEGTVFLHADISVAADALQPALGVRAVWTVTRTGELAVRLRAHTSAGFPGLPRFGLRLFLPEAMQKVAYYGLGPGESYVDKRRSCRHGEFTTTVAELTAEFHRSCIRPQESGSRADCEYVTLSDGVLELTAVGLRPFSFNASPDRKAHV